MLLRVTDPRSAEGQVAASLGDGGTARMRPVCPKPGIFCGTRAPAGLFCVMLLATASKSNQLLFLSYIGHIRLDELVRRREEIRTMLADFSPGFRVLADFTYMETMDRDCTTELGRMMEEVDQIGVSMVVRVMPDPSKDVGMNILAHFHYRQPPQAVTCETFAEAVRALSL
ncbi:MAG: hypothetical protein JWQ04_2610 [Pedosphaera sp.]|nr:hypothetical protein [Pedosphaera sp.]